MNALNDKRSDLAESLLYYFCKLKLESDRKKTKISYAKGYEIGAQAYADLRTQFARDIFHKPPVLPLLKDGQTILDIGSGRGSSAIPLLELPLDLKVFLTDPSESELNHAFNLKDRFKNKIGGIVCCKADHLPFEDETFDLVSLIDVMEHVIQWKQCLSEVYRVLKPSGFTYMQFPFLNNVSHAHLGDLVRFEHVELLWKKKTILAVYKRLAEEEVERSDIERPDELRQWFEWHLEQHENWINRLMPSEFEEYVNNLGFSEFLSWFRPKEGYIPLLVRPIRPFHHLYTTCNFFILQKQTGKKLDIEKTIRHEAWETLKSRGKIKALKLLKNRQ